MRKPMAPIPDGPNRKDHLFKPGQSGNPGGRRPGSRNRLCEAFLGDMLDDWEAHGRTALERFREERPDEYVKVMAGLMPKHFSMKVNELDALSDEEIQSQLNAVLDQIAAAGTDLGARDRPPAGTQPPALLPPLPQTG